MRWEYKVIQVEPNSLYGWGMPEAQKILNELGNDGWELVAVWGTPFVLFLKRPARATVTTDAEQFVEAVLGMG